MPLSAQMLWSAVRLFSTGAFSGQRISRRCRRPQVHRDPSPRRAGRDHDGSGDPQWLHGRAPRSGAGDGSVYPFEGVDLMYARLPAINRAVQSVDLRANVVPPGREPNLGAELFYVGTFAPPPGDQLMPMARSGTLGSPPVEIVKGPTPQNRTHYKYQANLVDCRSYGGFSGSPCYAVLQYANLSEPADMPVPKPTGAEGHLISTKWLRWRCSSACLRPTTMTSDHPQTR